MLRNSRKNDQNVFGDTDPHKMKTKVYIYKKNHDIRIKCILNILLSQFLKCIYKKIVILELNAF